MIHLGARSNASPFSRAPSPRSPRNNTALGNPRSPHGTQGKGKRKECHHCGLLLALRFTSPHGARPAPSSCIRPASPFQFTLPHGERPPTKEASFETTRFQFTLPHGERPLAGHCDWFGFGFNSRSRMGSDLQPAALRGGDEVSIHAPAWGATFELYRQGAGEGFQFTLPHGERLRTGRSPSSATCFNSRSRMGSDHGGRIRRRARARFNSRSRMGSDARMLSSSPRHNLFQFTLPHGERRLLLFITPPQNRFQFTLPHGERPIRPP